MAHKPHGTYWASQPQCWANTFDSFPIRMWFKFWDLNLAAISSQTETAHSVITATLHELPVLLEKENIWCIDTFGWLDQLFLNPGVLTPRIEK